MRSEVHSFFRDESNTIAHVVREQGGRHCAIIDAALDFDQAAGRSRTDFADEIVTFVRGPRSPRSGRRTSTCARA